MPAIYRSLCQRHSKADFFSLRSKGHSPLMKKSFEALFALFSLSLCGSIEGTRSSANFKGNTIRHNAQSQLWICAQWSAVYSFLRNQYLCAYLEPGAEVCDDDRVRVYSFRFFYSSPSFSAYLFGFPIRRARSVIFSFSQQRLGS